MRMTRNGRRSYWKEAVAVVVVSGHPLNTYLVWDQRE